MAIYLPSPGAHGWQRLLADPELHWKTGYSARTLAHSWEAARGLPAEVDEALGGGCELLLAIPEHKVALPGGGAASQCDVFALARRAGSTIAIAVEGKVEESFGPLLSEWQATPSQGKTTRLAAILSLLGREQAPTHLRYQLFHRTAAAILEAERFGMGSAAMVVHSFSPAATWFDDYAAFVDWLGGTAEIGRATEISLPTGRILRLAWAKGAPAFLTA